MTLSRTIARPLRWLGHGWFGLLLVGFAATLVVWAFGSHGANRKLFTSQHRYEVGYWGGGATHRAVSLEVISGTTTGGQFHFDWMDSRWATTRVLPFGIRIGSRPPTDPHPTFYFRIVIPCWVLALATGVPALAWFGVRGARHVRARRLRAASRGGNPPCPKCGYDLRATPHRCPECGTMPAGGQATTAQRLATLVEKPH